MNKTYIYTIKYIDKHSNGQWLETQHISSTHISVEDIIKFFGLDESDVIDYNIGLLVKDNN